MQKKHDDLQQTGIDLQLQISSYSTDFNGIIFNNLLTGLHVEFLHVQQMDREPIVYFYCWAYFSGSVQSPDSHVNKVFDNLDLVHSCQ